jgi:hypothetical protein
MIYAKIKTDSFKTTKKQRMKVQKLISNYKKDVKERKSLIKIIKTKGMQYKPIKILKGETISLQQDTRVENNS